MVQPKHPSVSLIIPCYNAASYIGEALNSIAAQSYPSIEIIIVDDGSDDRTAEIAAGHGPEYTIVRRPRGGTAAARNSGVTAAKGELLAFMDADDLLHPLRIHCQVEEFQKHAELGMCYSVFINFETNSTPLLNPEFQPEDSRVLSGCLPGAVMLSRRCWNQVGPFDETLQLGEFLDWYLRLQTLGIPIVRIERALYYRRIHASNFSRQREKYTDYARVLRNRTAV